MNSFEKLDIVSCHLMSLLQYYYKYFTFESLTIKIVVLCFINLVSYSRYL